MRFFTTIIILLLCHTSVYAQQVYVGGRLHSGVLSWNDFSDKVPGGTRFDANTSVKVVPRMRHKAGKGDSLLLEWLDVRVEVDSVKTWARPDKRTDELLEHEQGHLSLFVLWARELAFQINRTSFTRKNLQKGLDELMEHIADKYKGLNMRYDRDTDHMRNEEKQQAWSAWIKAQIDSGGFPDGGPPQ